MFGYRTGMVRPDNVVTLGDGWAVIEDNGERSSMEDRYMAGQELGRGVLMFGVFDGHNGDEVAVYCKNMVALHMQRELADVRHLTHASPVEHALLAAVKQLDDQGCVDTTLPWAKDVGSTACMVVLTHDDVWFVNVGDSRAVLRMKEGVQQMTVDHKPSLKSESDRVKRNGGFLSNNDGTWRINGRLNLSRSIGDWQMRPFIIATPTIQHHSRKDHEVPRTKTSMDEYIVIATDGLWDVMTNEDVTHIIDSHPHTRAGVTLALQDLVRQSRTKRSGDNITIIYIGLNVDKGRRSSQHHEKRNRQHNDSAIE